MMINFPDYLKELPAWGLCRNENGNKIPCKSNGTPCAQAADLRVFSELSTKPQADPDWGYRFSLGGKVGETVIPRPHNLGILDYDHVTDEDGNYTCSSELQAEIEELRHIGYVERSLSGTGFHVIFYLDDLPINQSIIKGDAKPEVFAGDKYVWLTGDVCSRYHDPVSDTDLLSAIILRQASRSTIQHTNTAKKQPRADDVNDIANAEYDLADNDLYNGVLGSYPSASEAAQALCILIAKNVSSESSMESVFLNSPFFSQHYASNPKKWHKRKADLTFRNATPYIGEKARNYGWIDNLVVGTPEVDVPDDEEDPAPVSNLIDPKDIPPAECLKIPGILQKVVEYYNQTAVIPQPQFAVSCALAIGSVACGRYYCTDGGHYSALYLLCVAGSGCGKEHVETVISDILQAANLASLIGPPGFTSFGALYPTLSARPRLLCVTDEFGLDIDITSKSGRGGNPNKLIVRKMLMSIFGKTGTIYRPDQVSTLGLTEKQAVDKAAKLIPISRPALSLIGLTTPNTFYQALTSSEVLDGFLPRFLIVESKYGRPAEMPDMRGKLRNLDVPVDAELIEWIRMFATRGTDDLDDIAQMLPDPVVIPITDAAQEVFGAYWRDVMAADDEISATGDTTGRPLLNRLVEIAQRVALIVSLSSGHEEITAEDAGWAVMFVSHHSKRAFRAVENNVFDSTFEKARKRTLQAVEAVGSSGIQLSKIAERCREFRGLPPKDRNAVIASLESDGCIQKIPSKGNKPSNKYMFVRKI